MDTAGDKSTPRIVAAIDIGSNAVRMVVAQVLADGKIDILERMRRAVHLGQDTFLRSRLSQRTILAGIAILRDYRRVLDSYHVSQVRAVATSAVREAQNSDAFLDRIMMATNLDVEVIEPVEEGRLTVNAVLHSVGDAADVRRGVALIIDVGGGGTLLTLLRGGAISASGSYALGSIRLQEMLATSQESAERAADLFRHQIASALTIIRTSLPLHEVEHLIAVGGDARFAAARIGKPVETGDLEVMEPRAFDRFVKRCATHTPAELARLYALPFADAETLVPALLTYQALLHATQANQILVSDVTMRDGLLLDLTQTPQPEETKAQVNSILQSAKGIGEKYRYDATHARHVADLAVSLFDALRGEHKLSDRDRLLLEVAAILHDVGTYVGGSSHHKHSYYLILNSEIFGLRRAELQTVALVARYHRRSAPKRTHPEYMALPREGRMVVSKLAAILRVADALDRGHVQQVRNLRFEQDANELVIYVPGVPDLTLERRALAGKTDLFEEVYGLNVRLEEADAAPAETPWPESEM
jgi:exopolyphosphatase/guanosine-5'-triphosphate,3'-diphosphate pyrophosphatase